MAVNPSNNYSYTRMGYKIDGKQYWICGPCELTPPFTDPDLHNSKYHMTKDSLKVKIPQTEKFEFPELLNKCTDATFNMGTLEYTNTTVGRTDMKLPSSNKEGLKRPVQLKPLALKSQTSGVDFIFPDGASYYLPPERDENSIPSTASTSTASALEVANPEPIQKLLTDQGKSLAGGQTQPLNSELETKNACKTDLCPNKRKRGKVEEIKIEEEFTNLRETLEESMAQILSVKQKLSEKKQILLEENAKMDEMESELRRRKESLDAASEAAEKEFNRVKAQEEDWKKKAAELQVRLETKKQARDLEFREREEVIKLEEAEVKARNLKLSEREKAIQLEEVELKARDSRLSERNELVKAASEKLENENKNLRIRETEQEEMAKRLELRAAALEMKLAELKYKDILIQQVDNAANTSFPSESVS